MRFDIARAAIPLAAMHHLDEALSDLVDLSRVLVLTGPLLKLTAARRTRPVGVIELVHALHDGQVLLPWAVSGALAGARLGAQLRPQG